MRNGLLSFGFYFLSSQLQSFPRVDYPVIPLVAPLWSSIPYRAQTNGTLFVRSVYDQVSLSTVKKRILLQNPDLSDYEPLAVDIITWKNFVLPNKESVSL